MKALFHPQFGSLERLKLFGLNGCAFKVWICKTCRSAAEGCGATKIIFSGAVHKQVLHLPKMSLTFRLEK